VGVINGNNNSINTNSSTQARDVGVYGRITIPIGAPRERLDCNELYQLELRKKRIEVQRLERELQNLKNLRFENTPK
jgi:bifunctional DNA-binding transcriptional regulator/antitoxin component of YhaV-PrlF toxin-antitoxin module